MMDAENGDPIAQLVNVASDRTIVSFASNSMSASDDADRCCGRSCRPNEWGCRSSEVDIFGSGSKPYVHRCGRARPMPQRALPGNTRYPAFSEIVVADAETVT